MQRRFCRQISESAVFRIVGQTRKVLPRFCVLALGGNETHLFVIQNHVAVGVRTRRQKQRRMRSGRTSRVSCANSKAFARTTRQNHVFARQIVHDARHCNASQSRTYRTGARRQESRLAFERTGQNLHRNGRKNHEKMDRTAASGLRYDKQTSRCG